MNNSAVAVSKPVPCVVCTMWERMPYAKRYTTPTTAQETETALAIGFWLARRTPDVPRFCPRHWAIFEALDQQETIRAEAEAMARANAVPDTHVEQLAAIRARTDELLKKAGVGALPSAPMTVPSHGSNFTLGPGPLLNGQSTPPNLAQVPSPLPSEIIVIPQFPNAEPPKEVTQALPTMPQAAPPAVCPVCRKDNPGAGHVCDVQDVKRALTQPVAPPAEPVHPALQPPSNVGTVEGALEAARQPPTEGAIVSFPCPSCQKLVKTGETHAC